MINFLLFLAVIYLFSCTALYVLQDNLIFFPPQPVDDVYQSVSKNEIEFSVNNDILHGWKIDINANNNKTILYFGGNAEDVVYINHEAKNFNVRQSIAFNHPGYGKSTGRPSQLSLYNNALVVYDLVIKKYQLSADDIVVMGRSLGSSVATYLAANREVAGLILITPFDSIENIASNQYKFFPVKFLLKHPFSTLDYIGSVKTPLLMLAADEDEIIAEKNLQNLIKMAGKQNRLILYPDVGHNTIQMHKNYYKEINNFIGAL